MNARVVVHAEADADLAETFAFLLADGVRVATRSVESAAAEFARLAEMPGSGRARCSQRPACGAALLANPRL